MGVTYGKCRFVLVVSAAVTILGPGSAYSQSATPPTTIAPTGTPVTAAPVTAAAPAAAAAALTEAAPASFDRKKALEWGFRPRVIKGATMFCKEEPIAGSTFKNTRCIAADQMADYLAKLQAARDAMARSGCGSNGLCGSVGAAPDRSRMGMSTSR
jgi:hypothetical protein